jgi:hypothetical protein
MPRAPTQKTAAEVRKSTGFHDPAPSVGPCDRKHLRSTGAHGTVDALEMDQ